ncbi:MAG: flagellar export protein FliJ [Tissierellia bacterium]|nr:flagellar export protein FliJ [Tissierellia bacterium]
MTFNFRLEKVLKYKKTVEDYKKNQYGIIKQRLDREENKLDKINRYKEGLQNEKNLSTVNTKVGNLAMYNDYINHINHEINIQKEIVSNTKKELEKAKKEMILAVQEKKVFEKLKENEYEKHLYNMKKQEEKLTDILVSYKTSTQ